MSCEVCDEWKTNQDEDTVVDEAFAFIYDETISGNSSPVPEDDFMIDTENVDVVVDEHFSFLNKLTDDSQGEPIYANIRSNYDSRNGIKCIIGSESSINTTEKPCVLNTGTINIHNGNTIINIPSESESVPAFVVQQHPDCSDQRSLNHITVYLDPPEASHAICSTEENIACGFNNNESDDVFTGEGGSLAGSECVVADNPSPIDQAEGLKLSNTKFTEYCEIDKSFKRLRNEKSDEEHTVKRICPENNVSIKGLRNEEIDQGDIEMDSFNESMYVEPNEIQVTPNGKQLFRPDQLFEADLAYETNKVDINWIEDSAEDNSNKEMKSSVCEKHSSESTSGNSNLETVKIDSPQAGTSQINEVTMEELASSCDNRSLHEDGIETFIEAKNDLLESSILTSLDIVSKNISESAATHLEKLLHLDKEVEIIDSDVNDVDAIVPEVHGQNGSVNETIILSGKSIAEALNPNILCGELKNTHVELPIVDNRQESVPEPNVVTSTVSLPNEITLATSETEEATEACENQTSNPVEDNSQVYHSSISNKGPMVEYPKLPDDDLPEDVGFAATFGRAIRRSMRRMRQIRLSGRRSKRTPMETYAYYNEGVVSEETEVRRGVPEVPSVGLASVRSPAAAAVILPSIMATLTPTEEPTGTEADLQSSQTAESTNDHTYNRSNSQSGHQNDLPVGTDYDRQQGPRSPPGYLTATQGSTSIPVLRSVSDEERHAQNEPLVDNQQSPHRQQSRSSRGRFRRRSLEQATDNGNSFSSSLSQENLVQGDATTVSSVTSSRSQSAGRSISSSSVDTTSDPSLLNERRRQSRRSSPSRQSSHASSIISGFIPPKREYWPHSFSGLLTSLPLTLNVFNISRFALFGAKYGWQFPIQWGIISLIFGVPLMVFHMAVGQLVGAGPIDMWVISPIFQGIGYGVLIAEALLGVYCCIPIAWMFTYFRESFDMGTFRCITSYDCENPRNLSAEINQVVPQFFVSNILARSQSHGVPLANLGTIHFTLAFNLLIIWIILFVALSRGAKTLGKICYLSTLLPFICFNIVCCYLIYIAFTQLPVVSFVPNFLDKQSWMASAREAFLVWALHGAALQQLAAGNRKGHPLWRDTTIITLLTGSGLFLASFCGIVCSTVLHEKSLRFIPSSFETADTRRMVEVRNWMPKHDMSYEGNKASHMYDMFTPQDVYDNFYVGVRIRKQFLESDDDNIVRSGYNSIRFMTEMFPTLLFTLRTPIEPTIPPLFYLSLLMFGLAHQISVWYTVIQGVIRMQYSRLRAIETFLTFCCCVFGFSAALPLATGAGMNVLYFLDFIVGSAWWLMILQLIYIFGILLVRGKPFSASDLSKELFGSKDRVCGLRHTLALCWTVLIPVGLVVATISSFQVGDYRQIFTWECADWPVWVCQLASALQLFPLILVPLVGIVGTCIFLSHPRHNFLQKLEFLYRPPPFRDIYQEDDSFLNEYADDSLDLFRGELIGHSNRRRGQPVFNDPPPKYTPPPSYSTATGSSLAKSVENTLRRSFRYLRRHPSRAAAHSQLPP